MKNSQSTLHKYQKSYADLRFERDGLFNFIQENYHPQEVLYPGCSVHITPAFFFPYVIFVDQDPAALDFFSDRDNILELVKRRRTYRRSPYVQFIYQDFTQPLPLPQNQFDLLLALFTRGVSKACRIYLKKGGLYLTNNHQQDVVEAFRDNEFTLIAVVQEHQGKYQFSDIDLSEPFKVSSHTRQSKRYLRQTSGGVEYIENESYYIFRRVCSPQSSHSPQ